MFIYSNWCLHANKIHFDEQMTIHVTKNKNHVFKLFANQH